MIILYADDDRDDVEIFCDAIHTVDQAANCIIAQDGREVLTILQHMTEKPDFIFLDINMPIMDGKKCLVELKRRRELRNIPVIMYSTSSNPSEKRECIKLGAFKFMSKHHEYTKLCKELYETLMAQV